VEEKKRFLRKTFLDFSSNNGNQCFEVQIDAVSKDFEEEEGLSSETIGHKKEAIYIYF